MFGDVTPEKVGGGWLLGAKSCKYPQEGNVKHRSFWMYNPSDWYQSIHSRRRHTFQLCCSLSVHVKIFLFWTCLLRANLTVFLQVHLPLLFCIICKSCFIIKIVLLSFIHLNLLKLPPNNFILKKKSHLQSMNMLASEDNQECDVGFGNVFEGRGPKNVLSLWHQQVHWRWCSLARLWFWRRTTPSCMYNF